MRLSSDSGTLGFAYAGIDQRHSIFQRQMIMPSAVLHEYGHNFRLGHANEIIGGNHTEYNDYSGQMGASAGFLLKRCFNGWNMWEMGWLKNRR